MNGYIWTDRWVGRYESSASLTWKLAWANCLHLTELRAGWVAQKPEPWVFGLEDPKRRDWHAVHADGEHEISQFCSELSKILVRDSALRYCRCCLQSGYISIFHQLSDLQLCPIHRCEISKHCRWCGHDTPFMNDWRRVNIYNPFHCSHCHGPLAKSLDPRGWVNACKTIHPRERLFEPLADWIRRLNQLGRWRDRIEHLGVEKALSILTLMEPLDFDRTLFSIQSQLLSRALVQHEPELPGSSERLFHCYGTPKCAHEDKLFYLVVRHIQRRYLKGLKRHLELYQAYGPALDHNPSPVGVHPLVHAYWRWLFFMCHHVHNIIDAPHKRRLWFQTGRNASMMTYWQYMQFTPASQMHYLLGCYFDFVRLAVRWSTASPQKATQNEPILRDPLDMESNSKEDGVAWSSLDYLYDPRFCGARASDSSNDESCFFYLYVSRDIVREARSLPYSVRSARRAQLSAILRTPELHEHYVRRAMKTRFHALSDIGSATRNDSIREITVAVGDSPNLAPRRGGLKAKR